MKHCNLCGMPVKVVGNVTKHYEPVIEIDEEVIDSILNKYLDKLVDAGKLKKGTTLDTSFSKEIANSIKDIIREVE